MFPRISAVFVVAAIAASTVARPGGHADPQRFTSTSSESFSYVDASAVNECNNVGSAHCCNSLDYASADEMQTLLNFVNAPVTQDTLVGHGCSPLTGADTTCNAQAVCCQDSYQGIGVSCNNFAA